MNYSNHSDEENAKNAEILIKEYEEIEQEKKKKAENEEKYKNNVQIIKTITLILITINTIILGTIYYIVFKKIQIVYCKLKKKDR